MTPNENNMRPPRFAIEIDTSQIARLSAAEVRTEEARAIEALIAATPEHQRAKLRDLLVNRNSVPVGADDREVASLLSRIASLRAARRERLKTEDRDAEAARRARNPLRVRVALVSVLPIATGRAAILRTPGDEGIPTILLLADANDTDLHSAIAVAVKSADRFGTGPSKKVVLAVRKASARALKEAMQSLPEGLLPNIRNAPTSDLPGVGRARYRDVLISRAARKR